MNTTIEKPVTPQIQSRKESERNLIKSMAGNYKVSFKFAETFSPIPDYKYGERHFSQAKEMAIILEDSEDKISIQHLLFVGKMVIKHWRQDWLYENREIYRMVSKHHWKKEFISEEEARGTWTQKVYQVDDCPRYQGYGTWVHVDGRHFWESTADAALPRREISTAGRTDYNILRRHSHIELFKDGSWLLEQDNEKIRREKNGEESLICWEKGFERFKPKSYDTSKTMKWWNDRKDFWQDVRELWEEILENQNEVKLQEDEKLYTAQFELADHFSGEKYDQEKAVLAIKELLTKHVEGFKS